MNDTEDKEMSMDDKKAIHYNITDDMMLSIISLFRRGQAVFEEVSGLLYRAEDICENLPASVREQELIVRAQDMNHKLSNYDCEYEGQIIVSAMQRLIDGLYEVENTYTNEIRENSVYFQSDVWRSDREPDYVGSGYVEVIDLEKYALGDKLRGMDVLYGYMEDNIFGVKGITSEVMYLTDQEIEYIYYQDMVNFILENYRKEYKMFTTPGIPSSVSQIAWEKIKNGIAERVALYKEATQLRTQLLSDNTVCKWNDRFINIENTIELVEIFHRNGVDTAEEKSYFLAQVYAETGGGDKVREKLVPYGTDIGLDGNFNKEEATVYILKYYNRYLKGSQKTLFAEGGSVIEFNNAIASVYQIDGEDKVNYHYASNHICGNKWVPFIGEQEDSPYQISDLILYRGGGALQITHKENYYRLAHYIEQEYDDVEAAKDIRENGCYSKYITDKYCLESAEWFYFYGPRKVIKGDTFDTITIKIHGGEDPERKLCQEAIYNVLSE